MLRQTTRSSVRASLAGLVVLLVACTPPAAPAPTSGAEPSAQPTPAAAAATTTLTSAPTATAAARPTVASAAAPTAPGPAATANRCKVAQVYASSTAEKGWSWAHAQAFLAAQQELPSVDLSIRQDRVPTEDKQAVADLIEHMVQQGATVVYTTSPAFGEPTRTVAARHPEINFFNVSGAPVRTSHPTSVTTSLPSRKLATSPARWQVW
jgi:basic membrane lipoprotein Med (substrate-binding protein (PBP1-ABC) superfamily)